MPLSTDIFLAILIGLVVGSLLNVIIYRIPKIMELEWEQSQLAHETYSPSKAPQYNLISPRSFCPFCYQVIAVLDSIPLLGYVLLKGKCRSCHANLSMRYTLIEAISAVIFGLIVWRFGFSGHGLALWIFMMAMMVLAIIDLDTQLLPDRITIPLIWMGLLYNLEMGFTDLRSAVIGAMLGYLFLWLIYWAFKSVTGKEGMGYGDFKMFSAIGACLGWKALPVVLLISSVSASLVGILMIVGAGKTRNAEIPFGPYLALAGAVTAVLLQPWT